MTTQPGPRASSATLHVARAWPVPYLFECRAACDVDGHDFVNVLAGLNSHNASGAFNHAHNGCVVPFPVITSPKSRHGKYCELYTKLLSLYKQIEGLPIEPMATKSVQPHFTKFVTASGICKQHCVYDRPFLLAIILEKALSSLKRSAYYFALCKNDEATLPQQPATIVLKNACFKILLGTIVNPQ